MAVATVGAFLLVEGLRILVQQPHVVLYGDQALLELGARRASHLDQLVGPYSREGFHHPGPAVFYLLAPFVRLLRPPGPGLYLGAVTINAAALVATVAVIWRRAGARAALWAAAAVDVFCLCLGVTTLREPWNPYLVVGPMILLAVLWAAGWAGSSSATLWAFVVGSYVLQTEVATAPAVLVLWAALGVHHFRRARQHRGRTPAGRWGPSRTTGVVALTALWLPVVVEVVRDRPNNIQLLWDFFSQAHVGSSVADALRISFDAVSVLPFGNHDYVLALHRNPIDVAGFVVLLIAGVVAVWMLRGRPQRRMSLALVGSALIGGLIGAASLTHSDGPVYLYFALWLAYVPLVVLLALGVALLGTDPAADPTADPAADPTADPAAEPVALGDLAHASRLASRRRAGWQPRSGLALGAVVAIVVAALTVGSDLGRGPVSTTTGSGPWPPADAGSAQGKQRTIQDTAALTRAAEGVLRPGDRWVNFTIGSSALWPYVAGMVVGLDERGVQSTVAPSAWTLYFGNERAPNRAVQVVFTLYPARGPGSIQPGSAGPVLADLDGAVLAYHRLAG